jgi:glycosyltransferase involved in cell wall biosynthesis
LLAELGLGTNRFVVQYAGNMGRTHGIEVLLDAAVLLKEEAEYQFLFIGSGAKKSWLEEQVARHDLRNVTILPNRPRSDQNNFLNACDVAIISFLSGMAGVSVPSRMYNVMAAGKPIIAVCDSESELALVVREEDIGWVVPPGDAQAIAGVIRAAHSDRRRLTEMGERARVAAVTKYPLSRAVESYSELLRTAPK